MLFECSVQFFKDIKNRKTKIKFNWIILFYQIKFNNIFLNIKYCNYLIKFNKSFI